MIKFEIMQAELNAPFEEVRKQWRKVNAPVYIRRITSRPGRYNIIPIHGRSLMEVYTFLFGEKAAKQILAQEQRASLKNERSDSL